MVSSTPARAGAPRPATPTAARAAIRTHRTSIDAMALLLLVVDGVAAHPRRRQHHSWRPSRSARPLALGAAPGSDGAQNRRQSASLLPRTDREGQPFLATGRALPRRGRLRPRSRSPAFGVAEPR